MHHRLPRRLFFSLSRIHPLLTAAMLAAPAVAQAPLQFAELARVQLPAPPQRDWTWAVVLGDVDGDGDLDMVRANGYGQTSLYVNDGSGAFVDATAAQMPVEPFLYTSGVTLGDVDGDGDPDLVLAGGLLQLYLNDGSGAFADVSAAQLPVVAGGAPVLGDVDGDGDLDILLRGSGTSKGLLLNDGSGTFTDVTAAQLPPAYGGGDELVDVDGDGDLDVVGPHAVWWNDGGGFFTDVTATHLPLAQTGYLYPAAAVGDVDGDGDVDLAVARQPCSALPCGWSVEILFCLNDGAGSFSVATTPSVLTPDAIRVIELGDVDGDGDLDLVVGTWAPSLQGSPSSAGAPNRLYLNDGSAAFTDATAARMPGDAFVDTPYQAVAFGDVDGDGDPDMVWGGATPNRLQLNLQRQLHAPAAPQLGQPYTLDAYLRYGPSSVVDLAVIYLSTGPASIPLQPFGTLGIDPSMAAAFPLLTIPQPAGVASVSTLVPNVPGLVGQPIYSQAMLVAYPDDLRLSNVVVDVIQ